MSFILDTNIISEFISKNPNQNVIDYINSIDEEKIYISVITIGEIRFGIERLDKKYQDKKIERLIDWLENDLINRFSNRILDIDTSIMIKWGQISSQAQTIGKILPIMDSLIASTCLVKDKILITRNTKDFEQLGIKIINPFNRSNT